MHKVLCIRNSAISSSTTSVGGGGSKFKAQKCPVSLSRLACRQQRDDNDEADKEEEEEEGDAADDDDDEIVIDINGPRKPFSES